MTGTAPKSHGRPHAQDAIRRVGQQASGKEAPGMQDWACITSVHVHPVCLP
jgi:hypothetical protein